VYAADEALGVQEALRAMTWGGAYLLFEEERLGTLEPGKLADLVVLSRDVLETPPNELMEVLVDQTFLAGKLVFERSLETLRTSRFPMIDFADPIAVRASPLDQIQQLEDVVAVVKQSELGVIGDPSQWAAADTPSRPCR
jgi:adenine deaminase